MPEASHVYRKNDVRKIRPQPGSYTIINILFAINIQTRRVLKKLSQTRICKFTSKRFLLKNKRITRLTRVVPGDNDIDSSLLVKNLHNKIIDVNILFSFIPDINLHIIIFCPYLWCKVIHCNFIP